jgi:hypothetical protein
LGIVERGDEAPHVVGRSSWVLALFPETIDTIEPCIEILLDRINLVD